ncbi:MAG: hypothetical protein WA005_11275 [Candidatus Binataceae bacterium]
MVGSKQHPAIEKLIGEILSAGGLQGGASRKVRKDFVRLARVDYLHYLRKGIGHSAMHELVDRARDKIWPHLNRRKINPQSPEFLAELASRLGVDFRADSLPGAVGLGIRGFYCGPELMKRPLIFMNTAHNYGAVSATFCHEVGHHLASDILGFPDPGTRFFYYTGYEDHLDDPVELAADALVSLASYPHRAARKIFGDPKRSSPASRAELTDESLRKVFSYLRRNYGYNLGDSLTTEQKLQYLAGVIHFAKLRLALLTEYGM